MVLPIRFLIGRPRPVGGALYMLANESETLTTVGIIPTASSRGRINYPLVDSCLIVGGDATSEPV